MQIRIEASALPGRTCAATDFADADDIHVGVQARNRPDEVIGLHSGDSASAAWTLDCTVTTDAGDVALTGPYVQNRLGGRFVYLSWVTLDGSGRPVMFRRAKLMLDAVPPEVLDAAVWSGRLTGRLRLTDARGQPVCASVRPPRITWSAEPPE
ncbi:DUF5990 family protein [Streptomyces sp. NPDC051322]|uniref:DUF5990 family protein n=1 Tax=Streptomyces sp. NPDC051322 TaxID=3154645 RepID=UPI00344B07A4